jgi:hypothetical protein
LFHPSIGKNETHINELMKNERLAGGRAQPAPLSRSRRT